MIADRLLTTMADSNARSTLVTGPFLVVEPPREDLVQWIAVIMAEVILGITMTELCERLPEIREELPFVALLSGSLESPESLEIPGIPGIPETPGIIASDWTIGDILCHLLWSPGGRPRARVYHKNTALTNATCHRLGIRDWTEQTLYARDHRLLICRQPPTVPQLTQLAQP